MVKIQNNQVTPLERERPRLSSANKVPKAGKIESTRRMAFEDEGSSEAGAGGRHFAQSLNLPFAPQLHNPSQKYFLNFLERIV